MAFLVFSVVVAVAGFIPVFDCKHWTFRMFDFIRLQLLGLMSVLFLLGLFLHPEATTVDLLTRGLLAASIFYQLAVILPYVPLWKKPKADATDSLTLLSVNVLQSNDDYRRMIRLVQEVQPDLLLTMETNQAWEDALAAIEPLFSYAYKVPKENEYGMHFYSKLQVIDCQEQYLVSTEYPSLRVHLRDHRQREFIFWGIHPPPPSPTQEPTAEPKDTELTIVAKAARKTSLPVIVSGDFNNVCWSQSSKAFAQESRLKDARLGRGLYSTFPVRPKLLRFPLDLLFHSPTVEVCQLTTLSDVGSDHLPLLARLRINTPG